MMDEVEKHRAYFLEHWESMSEYWQRQILAVGRLHDEGKSDREIADSLSLPEYVVRNTLVYLGKREHDPSIPFPEGPPELRSFLENFGKWPTQEDQT